MPQPSFVAILYVNRSGSTLLSRMLSDNSLDACVLPELGFVVNLLLARRAGQKLSGEALRRMIVEDVRSDALELSGERLQAVCNGQSSDDLPRFFEALATAVTGRPVKTVVFKLESLLYVADEAAAAFPGLTFMHLYRDPRAVVSSMLHTPVPEKPGVDMARGSLVYAACHWRRYVRAVQRLAARHPVIALRYEHLGSNAGHPALAALNLTLHGAAKPVSDYRIAALDSSLHSRIYDDFNAARIASWRGKLSARQVSAIERLCAKPMRELGYSTEQASSRGAVAVVPFYIGHAAAMVRHSWRTVQSYLSGPKTFARLRNRIRLLLSDRSR